MLTYLLKTIICSAFLLGYYVFALRNTTQISWGRFYLLLAIILSLIIPTIGIEVPYGTNTTILIESTDIQQEETVNLQTVNLQQETTINLSNIIWLIYGSVSLILSLIFIKNLFGINRQNKVFQKVINKVKIYHTTSPLAPFSLFNSVYLNNDIDMSSGNGMQILEHELVHVKAKHSYDKLFMQIICIVFWINPIFWIIKKELSIVHEFEADRKSDTKKLSELILYSIYPSLSNGISNGYFTSPIKRRLKMITTNKKLTIGKKIMFIPMAFILFFTFNIKLVAQEEIKTIQIQDSILEIPKIKTWASEQIKTSPKRGRGKRVLEVMKELRSQPCMVQLGGTFEKSDKAIYDGFKPIIDKYDLVMVSVGLTGKVGVAYVAMGYTEDEANKLAGLIRKDFGTECTVIPKE